MGDDKFYFMEVAKWKYDTLLDLLGVEIETDEVFDALGLPEPLLEAIVNYRKCAAVRPCIDLYTAIEECWQDIPVEPALKPLLKEMAIPGYDIPRRLEDKV